MIVARYLLRLGAILTICGIVVLMAVCMVGLLKPNSLNAGLLPANPIILPAQAMPGDPNAPTLTPLPPGEQATATAAAALLEVQPFADLLSTVVVTLLPTSGTAVAELPLGITEQPAIVPTGAAAVASATASVAAATATPDVMAPTV